MDAYILNGLPVGGYFDDYTMQGTNQVVPMNGTNQVVPMNGTNQVVPMNGTNQVVPMQGIAGEYFVDDIALLDEDDVPMQGLPDDYDDDDVLAYQTAYLMGDEDAMQGLFKKVKERRSGRREARAARKEERRSARSEKRAQRVERSKLRTSRMAEGGSFLDKLAAGAGRVGAGFIEKAAGLADDAMAELDEAGIGYDPNVVEQRALMAAEGGAIRVSDEGGEAGGLMGWWNKQSTPVKIGVVAGAGIGAYLLYKQFSKKRRK